MNMAINLKIAYGISSGKPHFLCCAVSWLPNSSPLSLTNCPSSWSPARLPISDWGATVFGFFISGTDAMKMWLIGLKSGFPTDELFSLYQWILLLYWVDFTPMNRSIFCMKNLDFEWLTDEFMLYCRSTQLREKPWAAMNKPFILWW